MKKAATILLWISLTLEVIYLLLSIVIAICTGMFGAPDAPVEGGVYIAAVLYELLVVGVPLFLKLILSLVIIWSMKGYSEKIITEIITIILFSGIFGILSLLANWGTNMLISSAGSSGALINYAVMVSNTVYVSFISTVAKTIFLVGVAFAIAYKKVEMVDIRRIKEEQDV